MKNKGKLILVILLFFTLSACNNSKDDAVLTISREESPFMETFSDLGLGNMLNFDSTWRKADETGIKFWAEGYHNGEIVAPNLSNLTFGSSPEETVKGSLGFGIIKPSNADPLIFLYTPGVSNHPEKVGMDIFTSGAAWAWDYAIAEDEEITINPGETKILGVYRETTDKVIRVGYNLEDEEGLKQLIQSNDNVIIFKIKVMANHDK